MDELEVQMTQRVQIIEHIAKYGRIDQATAGEAYGIARLASRIAELKKAGYDIESTREKGFNRNGKRVSYAVYRFGGK